MRFTPTQNCQVLKGKIYSYIKEGVALTCSLFVCDDQNGKPGAEKFHTTYMPTHKVWDEISIPSTLTYDTDFWIVIWIPPMGQNTVLATSDESMDYDHRNATKKHTSSDWEIPPYWYLKGDLCIRAIVSYVGVEEELSPSEIITLNQNSPNPVINQTIISYTLPEEMNVELKIYDVAGKLVRTLVEGVQASGPKRIVWNRKNERGKIVHSGVYFYGLKTDTDGSFTKVMVVF